jgi:hypothetical protein
MTVEKERLEILEMIQRGTITAAEGLKLIETLGETQENHEEDIDPEIFQKPDLQLDLDEFNEWRRWWIIPFWIGIALTVSGGGLLYWAWSARGIGLGFFFSWIPFLLGVGLVTLGWNSQTGPWLHLRIQQKPGKKPERIVISLPLPIKLFAWSIRTFGDFIPKLDTTGLDEVILALGDSSLSEPLSIDVDDSDDDEQVKIYIG